MEILRQQLAEELASAEAPLSAALAQQIAGLEIQLAQKQVSLDMLETAEPGYLFVLRPRGEPTIVASVQRGKTTIAVAGSLGLMIGVLLAFFMHYLLQIRMRDREEGKKRST